MKLSIHVLTSVACLLSPVVFAGTPAPAGTELYIISPADGAMVDNPVVVRFGLKGMGVAPAGVERKDTGHHHLLIDTAVPDLTKPIPADEKHRHFGGGQTEVSLQLSPGMHTLQLLLGDQNHLPHESALLSKRITVTIK